MEFSHITKTKNGATEEMIEVTYKDTRYPNVEQVMYLSLSDANLLAKNLTNFVVGIPF